MKKIICIIIAIMFGFNNAQAEITVTEQNYENVSKYAHKAVADVTEEEIAACYDAVKGSGTQYRIKRKKVVIECGEEEMIVRRRLF